MAANWGFSLEEDEEAEGGGQEAALTPLAPLSQATRSAPQMGERNFGGKAKVEAPEKELTDEDMENIRELEETHKQKYTLTVKELVELNQKNKKGEMK